MNPVASALLVAGIGLMLLSAVGLARLQDVFARMHAATKSVSLGLICVLVAVAILHGSLDTTLKLMAAILFQLIGAPAAAHALGRSAYRSGVPLWEGTLFDELEEAERAPGGTDPAAGSRS